MSKRSSQELNDDFEEEMASDVVLEKKLKKKGTTPVQKDTTSVTTAGPSTGIKFDEVMPYNNDPAAKFDRIIRLSDSEGIGTTPTSVLFFRIMNKNNVEIISNYQFAIRKASLTNAIKALINIKNNKN